MRFKKLSAVVLSAAMLAGTVPGTAVFAGSDYSTETISYTYSAGAGSTYTREMEKLGRGLVAVKTDDGVFLSWRLLDSEDNKIGSSDSNVSFNIYRSGTLIETLDDKTNYVDADGTASDSYSVAPVVNGKEGEVCDAVTVNSTNYWDISLTKPADETITDSSGNSNTYSFIPRDCSTGDLDGDGEYEIIVKWVSNELDVGNAGYSGTVRFAAYDLKDGKMWENDINLGQNVFSSAHTAQFLVYDFDGDGKSEMICQTSLGSTDGAGKYVSNAAKEGAVSVYSNKEISSYTDDENATADYRAANNGRITDGEEFLTVFDGETGEAVDTIDYPTARVSVQSFGKSDGGNRSLRFLADIAYLDGERPYAVYWRGYYDRGTGRTGMAGVSYSDGKLSVDYQFDTLSGQPGYLEGSKELYTGQGNHSMIAADVNNDGKDEFISGALCMYASDEYISDSTTVKQLKPLWCTFREHGDAHHIGDYDPTNPGLEYFAVHEHDGDVTTDTGETKTLDFGMTVCSAVDGTELFHAGGSSDTGRGVMANVGAGGYYQIWSSRTAAYNANGGTDFTQNDAMNSASQNFRVYWDGDLNDELSNGTDVTSWNGNGFDTIFNASNYDCTSINGSKSTPALSADLFGDWREELVYPTSAGDTLRVFTTTIETDYKMKTLMQDPVYRNGVAAEQTTYNQPPHVGFYMAEDTFLSPVTELVITSGPDKTTYGQGEALDTTGLVVTANREDGTTSTITTYSVSGYDADTLGEQTVTVSYMGNTATFTVTVLEVSGIAITTQPTKTSYIPGEELDTTGMVVTASYGNGTSGEITSYTLSGYDPYTTGEQTVTVTYLEQTATFTVKVLSPTKIEITTPPDSTEVFQNGKPDTKGMVVTATFEDESTAVVYDYTVTCDSSTLGDSVATVTYYGQTAEFNVTIVESLFSSLYKTYETTSTTSVSEDIEIGSYTGDFTFAHTVTVNSMPASASPQKNDTSGFFFRFNPSKGTGAGWQIMSMGRPGSNEDNGSAYFCWKAADNFPTMLMQSAITVGETYTFTYEFTEVGTGNGASVNLTITDSSGNVVGSGENLSLRNMTSDAAKSYPLTTVQVYNQASSGSTASVTIGEVTTTEPTTAPTTAPSATPTATPSTAPTTAPTTAPSTEPTTSPTDAPSVENEITSVSDDGVITFSTADTGLNIYAAVYKEDGSLESVKMYTVTETGANQTFEPGIAPDKVFMWDGNMKPVDIWQKD